MPLSPLFRFSLVFRISHFPLQLVLIDYSYFLVSLKTLDGRRLDLTPFPPSKFVRRTQQLTGQKF